MYAIQCGDKIVLTTKLDPQTLIETQEWTDGDIRVQKWSCADEDLDDCFEGVVTTM